MLATEEVLSMLVERGTPVSQKLLADYVRRGLLSPPVRARLRGGGRGSGSYWDDQTVEQVLAVRELRAEGLSFDEIRERLVGHPGTAKKRLGLTIWMPEVVAKRLEDVAKVSGEPIVRLMQLGARLYCEAPAEYKGLDQDPLQLNLLTLPTLPDSEWTFLIWARVATLYWEAVFLMRDGILPHANQRYLLWRIIQDGMLTAAMLADFGIRQEEIKWGERVVAELTILSDKVRLLKPIGRTGQLPRVRRRLMRDHNAVLVTAEGHDFNHAGAAHALAQVGNWLSEEAAHGG